MNVITVEHLSLIRGHRRLIRDLSFSINPGQITVIMGPNGSGKSSLLLALLGLLPINSGFIQLNGRPLERFSRRDISRLMAWQGDMPPTEFGLTVHQRLELALERGLGELAGHDMEDICHLLEIGHLLKRRLAELSAGERQRTELAATLLRNTPLWLLDEPVAHLDLKHQVSWLALMKHYAQAGKAILAVLHDVQQACAIADEVILISDKGQATFGPADVMLTEKTLEELFQTPLSRLSDTNGRAVLLPSYEV